MGGEHFLDNFHFIYASAKEGFATSDIDTFEGNMEPLLDLVLEHVPPPEVEAGEFRMLTTTMDWSEFVGRIAVGRIKSGVIKKGQSVNVLKADGVVQKAKITAVNSFDKLGRVEVDRAEAGEVVALMGIEGIEIRWKAAIRLPWPVVEFCTWPF